MRDVLPGQPTASSAADSASRHCFTSLQLPTCVFLSLLCIAKRYLFQQAIPIAKV